MEPLLHDRFYGIFFMCGYKKSHFRVVSVQSKILFSCKIWGDKNLVFVYYSTSQKSRFL